MGEQHKNAQEPDLNQLRKVRREKLAELKNAEQSQNSHSEMGEMTMN